MSIKKFNEFNEINEGKLKDLWSKIVRFFSSEGKNVLRDVKSTDDKEEKKEILNEYIETLAKEYIKEVKGDDGIFTIVELSLEIKKFLAIYKKIAGEKHPRDKWRSEYLGGHFAWKELLKITKKGDLDKYFGDKIDKLKSNQKEDLKSLEDEYEMVKNMIDDL